MKKLLMCSAAAIALCAGNAHAVRNLSNGFVVPNVVHNGAGDTTAVGLVNKSDAAVRVFWTFFDETGTPSDKGCFAMGQNKYQPFIWASESKAGMEGKRGYLVFAAAEKSLIHIGCSVVTIPPAPPASPSGQLRSATTTRIGGNAFQVNVANSDVAYVPVIDGSLTLNPTDVNLYALAKDSLTRAGGSPSGVGKQSLRYYIDGAPGGNDTGLVFWTTADIRGTHTVTAYDDKSSGTVVSMKMNNAKQNWVNAELIPGIPATHRDGFIEWNPSAVPTDFVASGGTAGQSLGDNALTRDTFTFSVITAPVFGAVQTMLGMRE